ncbi:ankyrin repeat domain-containing protein [Candidatus Phaeomarinobacter ectocarpi]|uniref:ankyrin repeat domain-containing protein n=1 Tax=Candidatus Phaeomarinibacter ectocarpi TaxID=1458461 RepID=UPI0011AE3B9D|nr:ankyrin repeat domain-containing protein [Candidatus Phaeomarinobacter ectocarpi]
MNKKTGHDYEPPDIFNAARNNDPFELAAAIQDGQTLEDVEDQKSGLTPIHVACIHHSSEFLRAAVTMNFDAWARDANLRLALDHARAQNLPTDIQEALFGKMYPPGWADDPVLPIR